MDKSTELDTTLVSSIATQLMSGSVIEASAKRIPCVTQVRTICEQPRSPCEEDSTPRSNRTRKSQAVGDSSHDERIKDVETNRFVAVTVNGKVTVYGTRRRE